MRDLRHDCSDGRIKPDLVAPGNKIVGALATAFGCEFLDGFAVEAFTSALRPAANASTSELGSRER